MGTPAIPESNPNKFPAPAIKALLVVVLLAAGCTVRPFPGPGPRAATHALAEPGDVRLARILEERTPAEALTARQSGFSVIESGEEALVLLASLIALADKTLDLQYYIWKDDRTGHLLLAALVEAAERGVRVRLLLDDMDLAWDTEDLAGLNLHPNFEVRLFNPFATRDMRWLDVLLDFQRITHRMHNKAFIADNTVAIVGGRNVGDGYFALDDALNFRDLDLQVVGPLARQISWSFDESWNSAWSASVEALDRERRSAAELAQFTARLKRAAGRAADVLPARARGAAAAAKAAGEAFSHLTWTARATVVADRPDKPSTDDAKLVEEMVAVLAGKLSKDLLIESPYIIPGDEGVAALCGIVKSGVAVRILTNSLASSDALTAYSGYRKYRRGLLGCGVDLHELRNDGALSNTHSASAEATSSAVLHSKAAVIDGKYVFVGSFNMDPRSVGVNTEIALVILSPPLAGKVAAFIEDGMSPDNAFRVTLEDDELVWHTRAGGREVALDDEPGDSLCKSLVSEFLALLPIEGQL